MYPNLYYALKDLTGIEIDVLHGVNTIGFFIALCVLAAIYVWNKELNRLYKKGKLTHLEKKVVAGRNVNVFKLAGAFVTWFIVGYKIAGFITIKTAWNNPSSFLFSFDGSVFGGILTGLAAALMHWLEVHFNRLPNPEIITKKIKPSDWLIKGMVVAVVTAVIGSKVFYLFEESDKFFAEPLSSIIDPTGFNFYGGLVLSTIAMWLYYKPWGKYRMRFADALAPTLFLGYGIGRIGCHVSGDGDWGINNTNPKPFDDFPRWLWAYDYPHNVLQKGIYMQDCDWGNYCYRLAVPVYPTPLYEAFLSFLLFALLRRFRHNFKTAGRLSAVFLMANGTERFFIEMIRINERYSIAGLYFTQAQTVAIPFIIAGIILYALSPRLTINKENNLFPATA